MQNIEDDRVIALAAVEKHKIPFQNRPLIPEEVDQTAYIMIRHGLSYFNHEILEAKKEFGEGSKEHQAVLEDPKLMDPELHPAGFLQCEAAQPIANSINFKVVFTSPMQRAIMSTIHMFKYHPNKANIQFKVLPIVSEIMNSVNCIAMDCHELMEKFKNGSPMNCGIEFDWSRMYDHGIPSLWQVNNFANVKIQQEIMMQLKITEGEEGGPQKSNVQEVLQETMKKHPAPYESWESLWQRGNILRNFLKKNLTSNPLSGDEKIAIVCHSHLIAAITSDGPDNTEKRGFKDFYWAQNC